MPFWRFEKHNGLTGQQASKLTPEQDEILRGEEGVFDSAFMDAFRTHVDTHTQHKVFMEARAKADDFLRFIATEGSGDETPAMRQFANRRLAQRHFIEDVIESRVQSPAPAPAAVPVASSTRPRTPRRLR